MNDVFEKYSKNAVFFYDNEIPEILYESLKKNTPNTLLDLGAGDGVLLNAIQQANILAPKSQLFAVELSEERCSRIKNKIDCVVHCGSVTNLKWFKDNSIDFIISTQVIEHVDEIQFLNEIKRVLKPEGQAYVASVISKYTHDKWFMLKHGWKYFFRFYKGPKGRYYCDPTHLREYESLMQYSNVFISNNFEVLLEKSHTLKVYVLDAIFRRIVAKFIQIKDINYVFNRNKLLSKIRNNFYVTPPGYMICEVLIKKK